VLGIFETVWALAAIVGVFPLMALLGATGTIGLLYAVVFVGGMVSLLLVFWRLPAAFSPHAIARDAGPGVLRSWSVAALAIFVVLTYVAFELILTPQSAWILRTFAVDAGQLGQLAAIAGAAELVGSLAVVGFVDRVGKRRAVAISYVGSALLMALLPQSAGNWPLFVLVYAALALALEFAIVATITLASTVAPQARGTLMATKIVLGSSSRALTSTVANQLTGQLGYANVALVAAGLLGGALVVLPAVRDAEAGGVETPAHA
jgi:predicted MFS family arabinose efflux permease